MLSTGLLLYVAFPFRTPLFLAVVIAAVLHDPLERLAFALKGRRTIASALMTLAVIVASGSRAVLATVIMLIALYFFLLEGARVVQWAWRVSPLDARQTQELTVEMRRVTRATVVGILATAVFQGLTAGAGYLFA